MNSQIIVFTAGGSACGQCIATKRALEARGIDYQAVDVDELSEAVADELRTIGLQLPIVKVRDGESWSGFRPDKIDALQTDGSRR